MPQTPSQTLANTPGAAFRAALNAMLGALFTQNSGATAPTATAAFMPWFDTSVSPPMLRIRNAANTAWVDYDMRAAGIGLDTVPTVSSMNTHTLSGYYRTASGATGNPLAGETFRFQHLAGASNAAASQLAIGETSGRVFNRLRTGGSWGAWQEEWDVPVTGRTVGDIPVWGASGPSVLVAPGTDGLFLGRQGGVLGYYSASGIPDAILEDQKASGVPAQTIPAGTWTTRDLNTEVRDPAGFVSIAANQFTVTQPCWCEYETMTLSAAATRIWNVTAGAVVANSMGMGNPDGTSSYGRMRGAGQLVAGSIYRVEARFSSSATGGGPNSQGTEIYTSIKLWRN